MFEFFRDLDRRWIFLLMFLSVAIPILFELSFPEEATGAEADVSGSSSVRVQATAT